jgi:deoxyribonuclease-4
MPLGAHLSTSKGLQAALQRTRDLECDALQIFSKSPKSWNAAPLDPDMARAFRDSWAESGFAPLVAHDSYLINLASPDDAARVKSIAAMVNEVERAEMLGCDWLVTHCGAHLGKVDKSPGRIPVTPDEEAGLERLAASLRQVLARTPEVKVKIALENTAAQGTCLGGPFEHLKYLRDALAASDTPERIGFCFDTCHAHAAGHDLTSAAAVGATVARFDEMIGWERVGVVHLNDAKGERGGRLDRHEHIGEGAIGRDGMRAILAHPLLKGLPFVLETPEIDEKIESNLLAVRELRQPPTAGKSPKPSEMRAP